MRTIIRRRTAEPNIEALRDQLGLPPAAAVRAAIARPLDTEFAARLRVAMLEAEVTERLRSL